MLYVYGGHRDLHGLTHSVPTRRSSDLRPTVTREPVRTTGGIDALSEDGSRFGHPLTGPAEFDPASDRVMMCGSMAMIRDLQARFEERGFKEGSNAAPGDFVIARAFVG